MHFEISFNNSLLGTEFPKLAFIPLACRFNLCGIRVHIAVTSATPPLSPPVLKLSVNSSCIPLLVAIEPLSAAALDVDGYSCSIHCWIFTLLLFAGTQNLKTQPHTPHLHYD